MTKPESIAMAPDESDDSPDAVVSPAISRKEERTLVGIGASAGGLRALKQFFGHMPADTGLPFVVVMHLSAEHKSHLAELLQPHCNMPVRQVTENVPLEPNHVYVIPPNAHLESVNTHLRLDKPDAKRRIRTPIDHFFRTMTGTHDGNSIGIVLTGTGSDGTLGLRYIRDAGGLTVAQSPDEAEYTGMPLSAISSGVVDLTLPLAEMPRHILSFARTQPHVLIADDPQQIVEDDNQILQKIFALIRSRSGHDFSRYKRSTVMRRIRRRMQINHIEDLERYLDMVRSRPEENANLIDDLLITVTEFFRDGEVFDYLAATIIPQLFKEKEPEDRLRIWSVGCATGEEAYSLAMLMIEHAGGIDRKPQIQVFASDLHERSLKRARDGIYPKSIAEHISPERLGRFFTKQDGSYRVCQQLRDTVVFTPHNLLHDPPFSHLDLIVCRNLLIYLQRDVQQDVISLFHYALEPDGVLVLGTAETIDPADLFAAESKVNSVYRRCNIPTRRPRLPMFPFHPSLIVDRYAPAPTHEMARQPSPVHGDLHARIAERYAPPSILVSENHDIVYYSALAGKYLQIPGGQPTANLFGLIPEPLRVELRLALHDASQSGEPARSKAVTINLDGCARSIVLRVRPITDSDLKGFFLIILDDDEANGSSGTGEEAGIITTKNPELEQELELTKSRLQTLIQEYEGTQEEMQASNEELQSTNEELRSTLEELETSREELQSMNEELTTVNQENRHRVEELSQLSGYLQNLLAATDIATLFLDRELRIMRFTPKVGELFNVRETDRGRPLSDITHRLGDSILQQDAHQVIKDLTAVEREMCTDDGQWFLVRTLPYRTSEDRIAGVVITLIDITRRMKAEKSLEQARDQLEQRVAERTTELEFQKHRRQELAQQLASAEHRERKRLAAILHDDLQQHLVAAKMQIATAKLTPDPQRMGELCDRVSDLVDQAISSSRNLTQQLRPPVLYEDGLIPAVRWVAQEMSKRYGLAIEVDARISQAPLNEDERAMLYESVRELLFNAVKHSGATEAKITIQSIGDRLYIDVSDKGNGFDLHALEKGHQPSTGLGLFSVRERIEMVGGAVRIHSIPGDGTRITLELELASTNRPEPITADRSHIPQTPHHSNTKSGSSVELADPTIRVLVVDDHAIVRDGIIKVLRDDRRLRIVGAVSDGVEAITAVNELQPDVVLMDINMPRLNGIETTRHLRDHWPDIHVVGLSVQDDEATDQAMRDAGASAFLSKSDSADTMIETILGTVRKGAE